MNMIMFLFLDVIPVVAVTYVLLFNGGSGRDAIALVMVAASLLIKVFEKKLGTYAKYLYISVLPLFGAVTLVVGTPGVFGAMVEAYFLVLFLAVPYYDLSVIKVCAVVTVVVNAVALIIFRQAYLCMYTLSIWVFIVMVYVLAIAAAVFIVFRARSLFAAVEQKEGEVEELLNNVRGAFEGLQESSQSIYDSLASSRVLRRSRRPRGRFPPAWSSRLSRWRAVFRYSTIWTAGSGIPSPECCRRLRM